ncbi:GGDEF domain-containing protein [Massilia arenosa]|uniref:diguanylate cyclase n=1 Tax=Zemynaea arenosa TaxID=2561931 RepID=A0A4Y9SUW8_9BURK|nr:ligand-binding sensor domain-containing diguanylate cyclase [Massilia arenosa]TFW30255.1 GGDEF domain-containing protein [Massilia arenosa]
MPPCLSTVAARIAAAALATLLLACPAFAAPTSPLRFERLNDLGGDELSVLALLQDRQGYIWVGTHSSGLYRYNGYEALRYANNPHGSNSLPHDRVSALFEDRRGRIWAGTQNGLARFNPETNDFTPFLPPDANTNQLIVKLIQSDGHGGMWIATWGGLQHFDPDTGKFEVYRHDPARPDSLGANDLNAMTLDDQGGLWLGTWPGGLDYMAPGSRQFVHYRVDAPEYPDPKLNIVRALHYGPDHKLWIGTEKGVVQWDTRRGWEARRRLDSPPTRINSFHGAPDGSVWAATMTDGILHWARGSTATENVRHRATDLHGLPANNVRMLMRDRGGMLWVATFTDGIALANLNSTGFARHIPFEEDGSENGPSNAMMALSGTADGKLWVGGSNGFALYDPQTGAIVQRWHGQAGVGGALSDHIVYSLYQQPGGPLWIGTAAGLNRLDALGKPLQVIHFGEGARDFINAIAPASNGALWLGTAAAVVRYDPATGQREAFPHDPKDPGSRSVEGSTTIVEDRAGRVWMGSEWSGGGLDMLDPASRRFRHFRHRAGDAASLADDNISMLYQDPAGRLWAATATGLNQILVGRDNAVSFRSYAFDYSVGHIKVLAMQGDRRGKLWLSTTAGLMCVDPDSGKVERYAASDGLTEAFAIASAWSAPDGTLYFGGIKGMTAVHPEQVRRVSVPPQVSITDISVFNQSLKQSKPSGDVRLAGPVTNPRSLTLSVRDSVFSIEFAALQYTSPGRTTYAYRLRGFDKAWVTTDALRRTATYTNLDPDEYVFEVKAANEQGQWSLEPATLTVTILPPFWATWWFRALAMVLTVALLAAIYRARVRRLTHTQLELQRLVAERTRELEHSNAKLETLSTTDGLTGIGNRRSFDAALNREWRRARRTGEPLALAMLDVDHFKAYNDHYGHQAGDEALRAVAELIASHGRRTSDVVARYGGEEFVLLMPNVEPEHALRIAREVCMSLGRLALPHLASPYGVVTISIGIAVLVPQASSTKEELVQRADRALYRAKQDGRNRAVLAS